MPEGKSSLDLIGVGEFGKSIPPAAWKRIVETACSTFEKLLAPITETTGGLGRFIKSRFERLTEAEKVIVATTFAEAAKKVEKSGICRNRSLNAIVLLKITEHSESQLDPPLRELWSNMLARELTAGSVHPEIANVLRQLTTKDIVCLVEIAKTNQSEQFKMRAKELATWQRWGLKLDVLDWHPGKNPEEIILERLGLIDWNKASFNLTYFGLLFLRNISALPDNEKKLAKA